MKTLFLNFWVTCGLMMLVAIADLIALPISNFGAGFVIAFVYFIVGLFQFTKSWGVK